MTPLFLAVDAGGTSTRAVVLDATGRALGHGRAGGGNPTSAGVPAAVTALSSAARTALAGTRVPGTAGPGWAEPGPVTALVAMAGERTPEFRALLSAGLAELGVAEVTLSSDLLGVFHSGTPSPAGYVLVAGTGSIAARVRGDVVERVVGGKGWLLGDAGSGFWVGHRVVRAVVAALDGQAPATALTPRVLAALGVEVDVGSDAGRATALERLVAVLYARRPVSLAALAPLPFAVPDDPVAHGILLGAADALADLLAAVRVPDLPGPVVVGGSLLTAGLLPGPADLRARLGLPADAVPVVDGLVGAAVLALRTAGLDVGPTLFTTLRTEVTRITAVAPRPVP